MMFVISAAALVTAILTAACTTQAQSPPAAGLPRANGALAAAQDMPLEATFNGRVEAIERVELRSRVGGALDAILYREGTTVPAGAPLFQVDRRPYEIALRRADAEVATIEAQLRRAREEFARAARLAEADAVATEELDRRRGEVDSLTARLDAARAAAAEAALNLEWTVVRAPVAGAVGRADVTVGNLVTGGPGDGTRLALLQSLDPIAVYFDLDPATAQEARRAGQRNWRAIVSTFEDASPVEGPIDFVDPQVGAQSGTLRVRARIANPNRRLLPSSVVRVTLRYGTAHDVTVVPDIAVGADQGTRYVLVAAADGTLERRPVTLGPRHGAWRALRTDAVRPGDQVVFPGPPGLRPGMKVQFQPEVVR